MSNAKTRLELTWIGKDQRPRLEPRILLENPELSYGRRVSDGDLFDNMLIHGDNLLALKALEQEYAGRVKCIYIDPPYNTGTAFAHYDDGLEHSLWLGLMRDRMEILRNLLHPTDGSLWVSIDASPPASAGSTAAASPGSVRRRDLDPRSGPSGGRGRGGAGGPDGQPGAAGVREAPTLRRGRVMG